MRAPLDIFLVRVVSAHGVMHGEYACKAVTYEVIQVTAHHMTRTGHAVLRVRTIDDEAQGIETVEPAREVRLTDREYSEMLRAIPREEMANA